jgi:hypothetical protein
MISTRYLNCFKPRYLESGSRQAIGVAQGIVDCCRCMAKSVAMAKSGKG